MKYIAMLCSFLACGAFHFAQGSHLEFACGGGPAGGYVRYIRIDPQHSSTLYIGTERGLLKSTNGGASWAPINSRHIGVILALDPSRPSTLYYGAEQSTDGGATWTTVARFGFQFPSVLVFNPTDSSTLYLGTGDGLGVFKSTNGGQSWTAINSGLPVYGTGTYDASSAMAVVRALIVDPANPSTMYIADNRAGIFKSLNGGASWRAINAGLPGKVITALVMDPVDSSTLYAAVYCNEPIAAGSRCQGGIFKTTDGGTNWALANSGVPNSDVITLAVDPSDPSTLYAGNAGGVVFRSTDSGANWTAAHSGIVALGIQDLVVDPVNPSTVYAATFAGGVFKTNNTGASWTAVNTGITEAPIASLALGPQSTLYAGTQGGGIFKSSNGGTNWLAINAGMTYASVSAIAVDPENPLTVYAGTGLPNERGGHGVLKSRDGGATWIAANSGLPDTRVAALTVHPVDPSTLYAAASPGWGGGDVGIFRSHDGAASWTNITPFQGRYVNALVVDPVNPSTLYTAIDSRIARSMDAGATWTVVLSDVWTGGLAIDPGNPSTLYTFMAGDADGYTQRLYKSTNGGDDWSVIFSFSSDGPPNLAVDPSNSSTLYSDIGKSTDGGATWATINKGLPYTERGLPVVDPADPATLYIGTGCGVFKSTDGGATWLATGSN